MINLGFTLSGEEFGPRDLVRFAVRAEEAGFGYALISDHFHPWLDEQGLKPDSITFTSIKSDLNRKNASASTSGRFFQRSSPLQLDACVVYFYHLRAGLQCRFSFWLS